MLIRTIATIAVLIAGVLPASAGPGSPFKWWQNEKTRAELVLTAQQVESVESIFQATLPRLMESKQELDRLEDTLSALITTSDDEAQVVQQIDKVEATRSAMSKVRTLMLFRMRRVLTPDQRVKLNVLHERWVKQRGEGTHK